MTVPIDALIITALDLEGDAVRYAGQTLDGPNLGVALWQPRNEFNTMPYSIGEYRLAGGSSLTFALAVLTTMGGNEASAVAATLAERLEPRCLAMAGVCAGHPQRVSFGDVVVASHVFQYDEGKRYPNSFQADHRQTPLLRSWEQYAKRLDPTKLPSFAPPTDELIHAWILERLVLGIDPFLHDSRSSYVPTDTWRHHTTDLELAGHLQRTGQLLEMTDDGRAWLEEFRYQTAEGPKTLPFRVVVGPMASGNAVVEDKAVWDQLADTGSRSIVALEMEAAAIGNAAASREMPIWLVAKGVMDHASPPKSDRYKRFAARASAEVLVRLLSQLLPVARQSADPTPRPPKTVVSRPPALAATEFQDRQPLVERIEGRLAVTPGPVVLVGNAGEGKTAVASRLFERLDRGEAALSVDAYSYLSTYGDSLINAPTIIGTLVATHPDEAKQAELDALTYEPETSWLERLDAVRAALGTTRVLVVVDHVEELLDADGRLLDAGLRDVFDDLAERDDHSIRFLLITGRPITGGGWGRPEDTFDLAGGLPGPEAAEVFRRLVHSTPPLRNLDASDVAELGIISHGHPRVLELVAALLLDAAEPAALGRLLAALPRTDSENLIRKLIDVLFATLSPAEGRTLQVLAVLRRPVRPEVVNHVLRRYGGEVDSRDVLVGLHARRVVRRDGERFYVPPRPDGEHILQSFPAGVSPRAFAAVGADYFRNARRHDVHTVVDLDAHFAEIDLRISAAQHDDALDIMEEIDEAYLRRWGQSDVLSQWRLKLIDDLDGHDLVHNLSTLADAKTQQSQYEEARKLLDRAIEYNAHHGYVDNGPFLMNQLAGTAYRAGRLDQAAESYEEAWRLAREADDPLRAATAHNGLGLCRAEKGTLRGAIDEFDLALRDLQDVTDDDEQRDALSCRIHLNLGAVFEDLGEPQPMFKEIGVAKRLAETIGSNLVLRAECRIAEAYAHLVTGDNVGAYRLAREAAEIGGRNEHNVSSRRARTIVAQVHLRNEQFEEALAAATAAARLDRSRHAPLAHVLQGIAALRLNRPGPAKEAFLLAERQARDLRVDDSSYLTCDIHGLAITGLYLRRVATTLGEAERAFRRARIIADDPGVVARTRSLLEVLLQGRSPADYAGLWQAATVRERKPRRQRG
ncbi:tetratricopeptide repeat protein [Actinoplanes sp. NPDC089786]|uniref:phosphorylase family protein n=1 Tax=Actinoplanes sp. NPDC089786 TaxID=3155185 RepID=UPI00343FCA67